MILGDHIRLRALERGDLNRCVVWINDPEITQFLLQDVPMSMDAENVWYEKALSRPPESRPLAIEVETPEGWTHIGNTSFLDVDWKNRSTELGIFIGDKSYWSRGYGRQAVRLMVSYGFDALNLNRIYLNVFATNPRAIRAYEHAGFVHEGRLRQDLFKNGSYIDVLIMSVLRDEWKKSQS
jgi:RimJ/RimL family protein N-acetyltransferase